MPQIGGMVDPNKAMEKVSPYSILKYRSERPAAFSYLFTGPSTGANGVASTPFTVSLKDGEGTLPFIVTPADSGTGNAGVFTPASVRISDTTRSVTFTYTPGSTGVKTISVTNTLESGTGTIATNPSSLSYTST